MSNDVYRMSVSFCSNVAAAEKIECQGDMIAAGSRIVAAIGGLPPASARRSTRAQAAGGGARRAGRAGRDRQDDDLAGLAGMVRQCDVYESGPASRARHHAALKQQAPDAAPRVEALLTDASTAARQRVSIGVWQILALEGPNRSHARARSWAPGRDGRRAVRVCEPASIVPCTRRCRTISRSRLRPA